MKNNKSFPTFFILSPEIKFVKFLLTKQIYYNNIIIVINTNLQIIKCKELRRLL